MSNLKIMDSPMKEHTNISNLPIQHGKNNELNDETVILRDDLGPKKLTTVKICDYKTLEIGVYLNDVIMEFYLNRWHMRQLSDYDKSRSYVVFFSFFYTALTRNSTSNSNTRYNAVKRWTKGVDVFKKDFLFIPICESHHWFMIVVCFPYHKGPVYMDDGTPVHDTDYSGLTDVENIQKKNDRPIKQPCILVLDALSDGNGMKQLRSRNINIIREWLAEEYKEKSNGPQRDFSGNIVKGHVLKVPQQTNNFDCGPFVLHFFRKFFENPIVDYLIPILNVATWFPSEEVQENGKKRREIAAIIQQLIPANIVLPVFKKLPACGSVNVEKKRKNEDETEYKTVKRPKYKETSIINGCSVNVEKKRKNEDETEFKTVKRPKFIEAINQIQIKSKTPLDTSKSIQFIIDFSTIDLE